MSQKNDNFCVKNVGLYYTAVNSIQEKQLKRISFREFALKSVGKTSNAIHI